MNLEEAKSFLEENDIRYVLAEFVNLHGVSKAKAVPARHFESVVTDGAGFAAFAVGGLGLGPETPDYMAVGDLDTLTLVPWMPGYARIVCEGHIEGEPWHYAIPAWYLGSRRGGWRSVAGHSTQAWNPSSSCWIEMSTAN